MPVMPAMPGKTRAERKLDKELGRRPFEAMTVRRATAFSERTVKVSLPRVKFLEAEVRPPSEREILGKRYRGV